MAGRPALAAACSPPPLPNPAHYLSQLLHGAADEAVHVSGLGHVGHNRHHSASRERGSKLGRRRLHRLGTPGAHHHIVSQGQELAGQGQAQAARRAGDDDLPGWSRAGRIVVARAGGRLGRVAAAQAAALLTLRPAACGLESCACGRSALTRLRAAQASGAAARPAAKLGTSSMLSRAAKAARVRVRGNARVKLRLLSDLQGPVGFAASRRRPAGARRAQQPSLLFLSRFMYQASN